jgi:hypothetical protein
VGEMTQALYAHMNNNLKKENFKKIKKFMFCSVCPGAGPVYM